GGIRVDPQTIAIGLIDCIVYNARRLIRRYEINPASRVIVDQIVLKQRSIARLQLNSPGIVVDDVADDAIVGPAADADAGDGVAVNQVIGGRDRLTDEVNSNAIVVRDVSAAGGSVI